MIAGSLYPNKTKISQKPILHNVIQSKHIIAGIILLMIIYNLFKNKDIPSKIFKQDINIGLLAILTTIVIFFAFFSVYYTTIFKGIVNENRMNNETIQNVTTEVSLYKQKVEEIFSIKKRVEEQKNNIEVKYDKMRESQTNC